MNKSHDPKNPVLPALPKRSRIRTVFMSFGYPESADATAVVLSHERGFKTAHGTMKSLVQAAHEAVIKRTEKKDCCVMASVMNAGANFCSSCGSPLKTEQAKTNDVDRIVSWFKSLYGDSDETREQEIFLSTKGWSLGVLKTGVDAIEVTSFDIWLRGHIAIPYIGRFHLSSKRGITPKFLYVDV